MEAKRPNVLLILSDQHRFCDTGYAGNAEVSTPNMDRLAREGACFAHAYSNCPVCVPARGTLFTGLHALHHGAASNDIPVRQRYSLADAFNEAGYDTAYVGKWHLGGVPRNRFIPEEERLGFRYWRGCNCNHDYMNAYYDDNDNVRHPIAGYEPIAQTDLALEYLKTREGSSDPWALCLCFGTPHDPYLRMPEEDIHACEARSKSVTLRGNVHDYTEFDYVPQGSHHAVVRPGEEEPEIVRRVRAHRPRIENLPLEYAGYYRHIEYIDEQIGRVTDYLAARGLLDDTIVIYTSDHGNLLASHGMCNKQSFYEESAHIPLVIRWPKGIEAGPREQVIGLVDYMPSILGLCGVPMREPVDGLDVSAAIRSAKDVIPHEAYLYSIIPAHQAWTREIFSWRALTDGHKAYAADQNGKPLAMYDLDNDPLEMRNLLPDADAGVRARLEEYVNTYDGFMPWQKLTQRFGLLEDWNKSQRHFGYPAVRASELE